MYFDKSHIAKIPESLFHITHFDINEPKQVENLLSWLNGNSNIEAVPSITPPNVKWPQAISGYKADLANREFEFEFFINLLAGKTPERAIFFEAISNRGKTTLISEFITYANQVLPAGALSIVDFKNNPSRDSAIETIGIELANFLPTFQKTNQIKDLRLDLRFLSSPVLLLFDTYEQASSEACDLIQNLLLAGIEKTPAVRLIIPITAEISAIASVFVNKIMHLITFKDFKNLFKILTSPYKFHLHRKDSFRVNLAAL